MNKHIKTLLVVMIALGGILLLALALATRSSADFENQYRTLLALNVGIIIVMLVLIVVLSVWLTQRFRKHVFGTRLMTRFALSFAMLGIIPSILLFLISTTFVSRTIDTWFNLKLDSALQAGISFGRERLTFINEQTSEQLATLADRNPEQYNQLGRVQAQKLLAKNHWQTLAALDKEGHVLWQFNANESSEPLPMFTKQIFNQARDGWSIIEDESDTIDQEEAANTTSTAKIHALKSIDGNQTAAYLYIQRTMQADFSQKIDAIQAGLRDYQATSSSRDSLKNLYRVTLAITLLVTSLAALAAAFLISNRMIKPILWLAQATQMVAAGHYALIPQRVKGSDELIQLVDSFGNMAQQLNVSQSSLKINQKELEAAKAYSEAILQNLSAGVLVFNHDMTLDSFNAYANRMFQANLTSYIGQHMSTIEPFIAFYDAIDNATTQHANSQQPWHIQQSIKLSASDFGEDLIVSIQGTRFTAEDGFESYVLVFDDISAIISAQRTLAWAEVAQRLAHEIKNPLTPIQLSAERIQMKLIDKLDENDRNLLERSTRTIVNQVQALQNMVNEFRDYGRTPEVAFAAVDLNGLIEELLMLYESDQGGKYLILTELDPQLPLILADEQQLRQVLHNLVKNALEAAPTDRQCQLILQTKQISLQRDDLFNTQAVSFSLKDNGTGFSQKIMARMFEPYNTSKSSGTGLGLPVVKKIIDAHQAKISIKNHFVLDDKNPEQNKLAGAQIDILFLNVISTNNGIDIPLLSTE